MCICPNDFGMNLVTKNQNFSFFDLPQPWSFTSRPTLPRALIFVLRVPPVPTTRVLSCLPRVCAPTRARARVAERIRSIGALVQPTWLIREVATGEF